MAQYAEKRDFLRMPIDCALNFVKRGGSELFEGLVINLSSKGILFTSINKFDEGAVLEITLTPSNSLTPPMEASVIVSRVSNNDTVFEIACEIEDIR